MARRIQRKRTLGWKVPANTVYVGRPTRWGNPFKACIAYDHQHAVDLFRACTCRFPIQGHDINRWRESGGNVSDLIGIASKSSLDELRGKNLACWCDLDQPCHAEVLLELANDVALSSQHRGTENG